MSRRLAFFLFAWTAATALLLGQVLRSGGWRFRSSLLELLPSTVETRSLTRMAEKQGHAVVFAVGSKDPEAGRAVAESLSARILRHPVFESKDSLPGGTAPMGGLGRLYWEHRAVLPSRELETIVLAGDTSALLERLRRALYSPILPAGNLSDDPLFQFQDRLLELQEMSGGLGLCGAFPCARRGDTSWLLIKTRLRAGAFHAPSQDSLAEFVASAQALARNNEARVVPDGLALFARAGRTKAESEIKRISIGSSIGVALLMLWVFRGPAELILGMAAAGFGLFCGAIWTHFLFGGLHLITLIFGGTLIGVSADYSLHYFLMRYAHKQNEHAAWRSHFQSQGLALLTSVIAYLALAGSRFGALREIAVFCVCGLASTFLLAWGLFPRLLPGEPRRPLSPRFRRISEGMWRSLRRPIGTPVLTVVLLIVAAGLFRLRPQDSLRAWQPPEPGLVANDTLIRSLFQAPSENRFYRVTGASLEEILQREEALGKSLDSAARSGRFSSWQGFSRLAPSLGRQEVFRESLSRLLADTGLNHRLLDLGYEANVLDSLRVRTARTPVLAPTLAMEIAAEAGLGDGLFADSGSEGWGSRVSLRGAQGDPLPDRNFPGVAFTDQEKGLSRVLAGLRREAEVISLLAYLVVCLLLWKRYGLRRGGRMVLVVAAVPILVLGTLGWLHQPLQFFGLMGLVLALGTGVDHVIFLADAPPDAESGAMGAVFLTAITTFLSFGLLLFSSTPALRQFSLNLLLGLTLFLVLAPLAVGGSHGRKNQA